jgi:hypothetical protein
MGPAFLFVLLMLCIYNNNLVLGQPKYDESVLKAVKNFEEKTAHKIRIPNWVPSTNDYIIGVSDERQLTISYSPTTKTSVGKIEFLVFSKATISEKKHRKQLKLNNGSSAYFLNYSISPPHSKGERVILSTLHFKEDNLLYLVILQSKINEKAAQELLLNIANSID